jgi:hypothetical protein
MSETINNLKEFLSWRGFGEDEVRDWGRCFYKYTACGPWVNFLMKDPAITPTEHPTQLAKLVLKDGQATLTNQGELTESFIQLLGYDKQGLPKKDRSWETYIKLVDDFIASERSSTKLKYDIDVTHRTSKELHIRLPGWTEEPTAYDHRVYYGDIGPEYEYKDTRCGCTFDAAGAHADDYQEEYYVYKDPDPDCDICHGTGKHQKWGPTGKVVVVEPDQCVGLEFGSIVEGSDVTSGPFEHLFPFESDAFDNDLETMEAETSFYWERDNSLWYVLQVRDKTYYLHNACGDIKWDGDKPSPTLRKKVETFIEEAFDSIPTAPGFWSATNKAWEPMKIPNSVATIYETYNDDVM